MMLICIGTRKFFQIYTDDLIKLNASCNGVETYHFVDDEKIKCYSVVDV
jgi:hypothetical protein